MSFPSRSLKAKVTLKALDERAAQQVARELERVGAHVTAATSSGVYLEGSQTELERIFHATIELEPQAHFREAPRLQDVAFSDLIEAVYFPTTPKRFG
jgi:hypothetical protein